MRHIIHQIFERYLNSEQAAFDASPRELWPTDHFVLRTPAAGNGNNPGKGAGNGSGRGREPARESTGYRESGP